MTKVRFKCVKCSKESWFDVNLATYIVTAIDLMCDDCYPVGILTEEEYAMANIGNDNPKSYKEYLKEAI